MLRKVTQLGILIVAMAASSGCHELICGTEATLKGTKKLDPAYLSQLYEYAASGQCKDKCRPPILEHLSGLGNRAPIFEALPNKKAVIKLSVCVDEGVMLGFKEIGTPQAAIYAAWSFDDIKWNSTLLWSASPNKSAGGPN